MTVLVVAAHPDDEVLGAGATLAGHIASGEPVHAVVLADGATSRYEDEMVQTLQDCGRRAADVLGLTSIRFCGLPDQRLDALPLIGVVQQIESLVDELQPDTVYTHFPFDVNADHAVVARAAWTACRPYRFPRVTLLACFETPSSTEWGLPFESQRFTPTRFVDVSAHLDRKVAAMDCYTSELRDWPHPRSARALRERAAFWGSVAGCRAVEPFVVLRQLL